MKQEFQSGVEMSTPINDQVHLPAAIPTWGCKAQIEAWQVSKEIAGRISSRGLPKPINGRDGKLA